MSAYLPGVSDNDPNFNLQSVGDPPEFIETTIDCPTCKTTGRVEYETVTRRFFGPFVHSTETCETCGGTGEIEAALCSACGGQEWECKCEGAA